MVQRGWLYMVPLALLAAALAVGLPSQPDKPVSGPPPGVGARPTFDDEFEGSAVDEGKWTFTFARPGREEPTIAKRNLWNNHERQVYVDREFLKLGIDPFRIASGVLTIEARPLSATHKAIVAADVKIQPPEIARTELRNVSYSSGMISSRKAFSQTYGYFEIRARWSSGKGIWPAFWLLPAKGGWPPEIDVIEAHGDKPGVSYQTLHSKFGSEGTHTIRAPADDGEFHNYGMLWQADRISFFIDDRLTASEPTPADMHQPMYVVANLAIGGKWPGDPDSKTSFPARMEIDHIRAWSVAPKSTP
jgi:beta-glucanase (GH16 family)